MQNKGQWCSKLTKRKHNIKKMVSEKKIAHHENENKE